MPPCGQGRAFRQNKVNTMLNRDMLREATQLTQAGQLTEATALLQRMLRGERPLAETAADKGLIRFPGQTPPMIDLKANEVDTADSIAPAEAPATTARWHRPLFDRAKDGTWLGMRGAKRALRWPTLCRKERSSSKAHTAITPEAGPTSSSSPAATTRVSRCRWW